MRIERWHEDQKGRVSHDGRRVLMWCGAGSGLPAPCRPVLLSHSKNAQSAFVHYFRDYAGESRRGGRCAFAWEQKAEALVLLV